jgi:hypothetical protein
MLEILCVHPLLHLFRTILGTSGHLRQQTPCFGKGWRFENSQKKTILAGEYKYKIYWQKSFVVANPSHGINRPKKVNSNSQNNNSIINNNTEVGMNGEHSI